MMIYAESDLFFSAKNPDGSHIIVEIPSASNPNKKYRVDLTAGSCSCPAWIFQRGERRPCKHLREMGFHAIPKEVIVQEPPTATPIAEQLKEEL